MPAAVKQEVTDMGSVSDCGGGVVRTERLHQTKRGEFEGIVAGAKPFSSCFQGGEAVPGEVAASTGSGDDIERVIQAWEIPLI